MGFSFKEDWQHKVHYTTRHQRMVHQVMQGMTIQQHLLTHQSHPGQLGLVHMIIHGGASTPASSPPSPDPLSMTASACRALQVCTKLDTPPIAASSAQKATTLINPPLPPARLVRKVTTPTPPDKPLAQPAQSARTTNKLVVKQVQHVKFVNQVHIQI